MYAHTVDSVVNCQEGLDLYNSGYGEYDIIICDLNTPELNGTDLIKEIRKVDKKIKICVVTGHSPSELNDLINEEDIDGIFEKPVRTEVLVTYLESIL